MDKDTLLEREVDEKVSVEEILAQNNLSADFWVQLFHLSIPRYIAWASIGFVYFKFGNIPAIASLLVAGILLWKKFPVTIQEKERTILVYILSYGDRGLKLLSKKVDELYERYMNW